MYRFIWKHQNKPITTCNGYRPTRVTTKDSFKVVVEGPLSHDQFGLSYYSPDSPAVFQEGEVSQLPDLRIWCIQWKDGENILVHEEGELESRQRSGWQRYVSLGQVTQQSGAFFFYLICFQKKSQVTLNWSSCLHLVSCRGFLHVLPHLIYIRWYWWLNPRLWSR